MTPAMTAATRATREMTISFACHGPYQTAMKKEHQYKSVPSFDVFELQRIRAAVFQDSYDGRPNPLKTGVIRVMLWTCVLWQFAMFGKALVQRWFQAIDRPWQRLLASIDRGKALNIVPYPFAIPHLTLQLSPHNSPRSSPDGYDGGALLVGRGSLMSEFCPIYEDIVVPNGMYDTDGIPKMLLVTLRLWKGNTSGQRTQQLIIRRNYLNAEYCPVVAMLIWLAMSG